MSNIYCVNCGKYGHCNKKCDEPTISCGIICFKIDNFKIKKIKDYFSNKFIDISDYNYKNLNYIHKLDLFKNNIRFLLIQRKHSISFIEFIRGKYNENDNNKIKSMFELMSKEEVKFIKENDFDFLWTKLWQKTATKKIFQKEFNVSKNKFNYLVNNKLIDNLQSNYDTPEWEFPKGKRNKNESNLECATREFIEETTLEDFSVFHRFNSIEETFEGTNKLKYKNIYYLAGSDNDNDITCNTEMYEVGSIGWFTLDEALTLLRPYYLTKKNIINQIYFFISIIADKINNNKELNIIKNCII